MSIAIPLTISLLAITVALLSIARAIDHHAYELRAIAEQQADERRRAGIAGFDAGWHTTSRGAR